MPLKQLSNRFLSIPPIYHLQTSCACCAAQLWLQPVSTSKCWLGSCPESRRSQARRADVWRTRVSGAGTLAGTRAKGLRLQEFPGCLPYKGHLSQKWQKREFPFQFWVIRATFCFAHLASSFRHAELGKGSASFFVVIQWHCARLANSLGAARAPHSCNVTLF